MRTIAFYDDNPDFGGHQIMAMRGIAAVAKSPECRVIFYVNPANARLREHAAICQEEGGQLELRDAPTLTRKFQALRNRFASAEINALAQELAGQQLDGFVAIQGEIEDSSLALLAARQAGLRVISYIPLAHTLAQMGAKLGHVRDLTTKYLFTVPDAWLTITESVAKQLRSRGAHEPIYIVNNGIDTERFQPASKAHVRAHEGLPEGTLFGLFGRVEFKQKQQDFLVHALASFKGQLERARLLVVGDGPDHERLTELVIGSGLSDRVIFRRWHKHTEQLYPALDCLIIPSRFEGFPLVMLEAAACQVPVVGSDRDGMHDFLPPGCRFHFGDVDGLEGALIHALKKDEDELTAVRQHVLDEYSLKAFEHNFTETLNRALSD
ncbi:glycosyltransferase family 4 protein [Ruficoccus sp. ZRK36]|uniref:glycosyltransferase family 4 protein n=1 Tax=Ruficoccus sp. ZRK36 TaxID=2866311 RepID=UPI001C736843|nr:glycosyltransferase family 4 protein [Ruficoccus sp. ZRK36]QYY34903.1 glycosyltransferase family 4 protein [Ruficoccus sp. ZRK36]